MSATHYSALEIEQSASDEQVRTAVRQQRRRWMQLQGHPKLETRQEAELRVREVSEAEAVLTDPARRKAFDLTLRPVPQPVAQPSPSPRPPIPDPWRAPTPNPTKAPPRPETKRRLLIISGLAVLGVLATAILAGQLGGWIRGITGNYPDFLRDESILQPETYLVDGTNAVVGAGVIGIVFILLFAIILIRWKKAFGIVILVIGISISLVPVVLGMVQFPGQAQALIKSGLCNGGQGSSGRVEMAGRTVRYGLAEGCTGVILWDGLQLLRVIDAPRGLTLDLHPDTVQTATGGQYIGASTMATDSGGPYQAVIFRIDAVEAPKVVELTAPPSTQGNLEASNGLFIVERQIDGVGVVKRRRPLDGELHLECWLPRRVVLPPALEGTGCLHRRAHLLQRRAVSKLSTRYQTGPSWRLA
jgi:hypothetical protein